MSDSAKNEWPLWEVFVRPKAGLDHKHCGSLHAADAAMALQLAREVYRRYGLAEVVFFSTVLALLTEGLLVLTDDDSPTDAFLLAQVQRLVYKPLTVLTLAQLGEPQPTGRR